MLQNITEFTKTLFCPIEELTIWYIKKNYHIQKAITSENPQTYIEWLNKFNKPLKYFRDVYNQPYLEIYQEIMTDENKTIFLFQGNHCDYYFMRTTLTEQEQAFSKEHKRSLGQGAILPLDESDSNTIIFKSSNFISDSCNSQYAIMTRIPKDNSLFCESIIEDLQKVPC